MARHDGHDRPWVWRVRFYWKAGPYHNTWESSCDAAMPEGSTAMDAIKEVASWRNVDLDKVYSIECERLLPDPHLKHVEE